MEFVIAGSAFGAMSLLRYGAVFTVYARNSCVAASALAQSTRCGLRSGGVVEVASFLEYMSFASGCQALRV